MEAASARMAARRRFDDAPASTTLQRYILNACDPSNFEPNLALNLEITDLINQKKGNAPREAAVAIVHFINHRNQNVAMLALNLLDICVKNCGYPFHLQISTKDFLNELVRRFPERPPVHPTRVQNRILELIEEWRQTICATSRYKEDLGFIRDMHRLLSYKGYMFPEVRTEDAAVLNPSDNLRSAEEMEEEERSAQSAKLQELIRRGTPHDLQEANKLMKVMAGYDNRNKTDYRAKAAEEVSRVQQKAKLLEDMLQNYKPGDEIKEGDVYEELANALTNAHPKIQKMCEEESEDHEAVAKLFEINDSIHRTIERYKLIKKGDHEGAAKIPKGTLGSSGAGVSKGPDNELSLIDLGGPDDEPSSSAAPAQNAPASQPAGNTLENDLLGLSLDDSYGQGGDILLGGVPATQQTPEQQSAARSNIMNAFNQPSISPQPTGSQNFNMFNNFGNAQSPAPQATSPPPQPPKPVDPFASLSTASSTPRQGSPFQFQQSTKPANASGSSGLGLIDVGSSAPSVPSPAPAPAPAQAQAQQQSNGDDDWDFSSALPDQPSDITVTNSSVNIVFTASRQGDIVLLESKISNNTPQPISNFAFQLAVMKGYSLNLQPQTGTALAPSQRHGITQTIKVNGIQRGNAGTVKFRWKASYTVGAEGKNEQGEIAGLPIS